MSLPFVIRFRFASSLSKLVVPLSILTPLNKLTSVALQLWMQCSAILKVSIHTDSFEHVRDWIKGAKRLPGTYARIPHFLHFYTVFKFLNDKIFKCQKLTQFDNPLTIRNVKLDLTPRAVWGFEAGCKILWMMLICYLFLFFFFVSCWRRIIFL